MHQRIKCYIEHHGIVVRDVAQKSAIPEAVLNAILNGEKTLYADELRAICLALNVSPEVFVEK